MGRAETSARRKSHLERKLRQAKRQGIGQSATATVIQQRMNR